MRTGFVLVLIVLLFSALIMADNRPFSSEGDIKFYLDYAGFKGSNGRTYNEFYISVFTDQLEQVNLDSGLIAQIKISVNIRDNFGKSHYSNSFSTDISIPIKTELSKNLISYDQWTVILAPGEYSIWVEMEDQKSGKSGALNNEITVREYSLKEFRISEVEFVSSYEKNGQSQFQKGNLFIKPNPWRRYGVLNPVLYVYFELYNLSKIKSDSIRIYYSIIDNNEKKFRKLSTTKKNDKANSTIFHGIDVSNIPSGIYKLLIEVEDLVTYTSIKSFQNFEIIQPDYLELSASSNQVFTILDKLSSYIMTDEQSRRYEKLEQKQKSKFLENIWNSNNQNITLGENEYLLTIIARYNYAEKNFSWGPIDGWKSDRGRIIIVYGIPDELDKRVFEDDTLPYEIWKYHQDREFQFVFSDLRSDGRYTLIHSTKEGEIFNPKWYSEIKK